jgi:hypothetical protein
MAVDKWITAILGNEDSNYFVGYFYSLEGCKCHPLSALLYFKSCLPSYYCLLVSLGQGYDCNPGSTFTATTGMAACITTTVTSIAIWTTCLNNSVMVRSSSPSSFTWLA